MKYDPHTAHPLAKEEIERLSKRLVGSAKGTLNIPAGAAMSEGERAKLVQEINHQVERLNIMRQEAKNTRERLIQRCRVMMTNPDWETDPEAKEIARVAYEALMLAKECDL